MVPNPFRLISRVLPGGGDTDREAGGADREPVAAADPAETDEREETEPAQSVEAEEADAPEEEWPEDDAPEEEWPEEDEEEEDRESVTADAHDGGDAKEIDASGIPAPSIGPNTKITLEDPAERLARHEQSDVDAMGRDKRREVIGGSYSPSFAKQATLYGLFLLVVGLLFFGGILAVNEFDQPPEEERLDAPWKDSTEPGNPSQIDFPPDSAPDQVPTGPDPTSEGGGDRT